MSPAKCPFLQRRHHVSLLVGLLLGTQTALLAYSATQHSPTSLEPPLLAAGLSHWEFQRFELYRVNPPLVRAVASLPVLAVGYKADWSGFFEAPGARPEFEIGADFIAANGERSLWLITLARWACIPFSLLGGLFTFGYARELWRSDAAGLLALSIWCFEPNILAHSELITNDVACTSFGLGATWLFWRWLRQPTWGRAVAAGLLFGLAQLSKSSWLILFVLWPALYAIWQLMARTSGQTSATDQAPGSSVARPRVLQLLFILSAGLMVLNAGYMFDGSFTPLNEYQFVSAALNGGESGEVGNRFARSILGMLPTPLPKQYVLGLDSQKRDFEAWTRPNYLRGQWKPGGWWYYYLYGLMVKLPHGLQLLLAMALLWPLWERAILRNRRTSGIAAPMITYPGSDISLDGLTPARENTASGKTAAHVPSLQAEHHKIPQPSRRDQMILLGPGITIFIMVSTEVKLNEHFRYILPAIGVLIIFAGRSIYFCRRLTGAPGPR